MLVANMNTFPSLIKAIAAVLLVLPHVARANPDDFTVRSVNTTNVFKLSAARGKWVALHFLLKTECPYCIRHTHDYLRKAATNANVVHVFLKPDTDNEVRAWAGKLGAALPKLDIYRDPGATLAKAFNIRDGYKFHGQSVHYPALVLLDGSGKEVFRYVGKSNADRFSYEKFAAKLEELAKASPR